MLHIELVELLSTRQGHHLGWNKVQWWISEKNLENSISTWETTSTFSVLVTASCPPPPPVPAYGGGRLCQETLWKMRYVPYSTTFEINRYPLGTKSPQCFLLQEVFLGWSVWIPSTFQPPHLLHGTGRVETRKSRAETGNLNQTCKCMPVNCFIPTKI